MDRHAHPNHCDHRANHPQNHSETRHYSYTPPPPHPIAYRNYSRVECRPDRQRFPRALQNVLSRLNRSTVDSELTERMWQYAERDRLRGHVGNVNYLTITAFNRGNDAEYRKIAAYREEAERQYREFITKYNFPVEEERQPTPTSFTHSALIVKRLQCTGYIWVCDWDSSVQWSDNHNISSRHRKETFDRVVHTLFLQYL